jgi:glycosyltransferase involved in cell wall biosynthesis
MLPVTHLMPVRNGALFLNKSLNGILANTKKNDEILIIDDGSTDYGPTLIKRFQEKNSIVNVITTKGIGIVGALNLGLKAASFEWVARYDVDDIYEPNRVQLQINKIKPNTAVIFSDYDIQSNRIFFGTIPSPILHKPSILSLIYSQQTAHPSALICKSAAFEAGLYKIDEYPAEDVGLWTRMSLIGNLESIPEVLLHYKLNKSSITAINRKKSLITKDRIVQEFFLSKNNFSISDEEVKFVIDYYKNFDMAAERTFLFLRNLIKFEQITGRNFTNRIELLFKKNLFLKITKMTYFTLLRKVYRTF